PRQAQRHQTGSQSSGSALPRDPQDLCNPRPVSPTRRSSDNPARRARAGCAHRLLSWPRNRILMHAAVQAEPRRCREPRKRQVEQMMTERRNPRSVDIDLLPTERILKIINADDAVVANVVASAIPQIAKVVETAADCIRGGGRIIYIGAGTSGRLAILDAVEIPPTFSTSPEWIQAVMAGGVKAFTQAIEGSEDDR